MRGLPLSSMEKFLLRKRSIRGLNFTGSRLLQAIQNGDILYNNRQIYLHTLDRDILNIYAHSFYHSLIENKKWLLLYPSEKFELFALFALENFATTSYIQEGDVLTHDIFNYRNKVLLISDDKSVRAEYIHLKKKYEKNSLNTDYLRLGIVGMNQKIRSMVYSSEKQKKIFIEPFFFISPSTVALPNEVWAKMISVVIIDLKENEEYENIDKILAWTEKHAIPYVLFISRYLRSKPVIHLIEKNIPYWGWNDEVIRDRISNHLAEDEPFVEKYSTPFNSTYSNMVNLQQGITNIVIPVTENQLNSRLLEIKKDNYILKKNSIINTPTMKAVNQINNFIMSIEEMPAPLEYCNKYLASGYRCITTSGRISQIEYQISFVRQDNPVDASYLSGILNKIRNLIDYMGEGRSGKPIVIEDAIKTALKTKNTLAVVCRISALKFALMEYLEKERKLSIETLNDNGISLLTHNEYMLGPEFDAIIYYGVPRQQNLGILGCSNTRTKGFLLYASERRLFDWILEQDIGFVGAFSYDTRIDNLSRITGIPVAEIKNYIIDKSGTSTRSREPLIVLGDQDSETAERNQLETMKLFDVDEFNSLKDFVDYGETLEKEEQISSTLDDETDDEIRLGKVESMKITLASGKIIYIPTSKHVSLYDMTREKIINERKSIDMEVGNVLILIDKSSARGLAEAIVSRVKSHPSMVKTVVYQQLWIEQLTLEMAKNNHSPTDVSGLLYQNGVSRSPTAVYLWINGYVIGPSDIKVIKALGTIYNNVLLRERIDFIWSAIKRLRKIHITIGHRLKYFAPQYALRASDKDELVDEGLNLYLSDFKDLVSLEEIVNIEGPFPIDTNLLNRLQEGDENDSN